MKPEIKRLNVFFVHAWAFHYNRWGRCYSLWATWDNLGLYQQRKVEAIKRIKTLTGLSQDRARHILYQGEGTFWFTKAGGWLRLQAPKNLRRCRWKEAGMAKFSKYTVPLSIHRQGIQTLRAFMSLAVIISPKAQDPVARAYTAKCLSATLPTVSAYRKILKQEGYVNSFANYRRVANSYGKLKSPCPGERNVFAKGLWWYKRLPDSIVIDRRNSLLYFDFLRLAKSTERKGGTFTEKPDSLRESSFRLERFGKRLRLGRRLERLSNYYEILALNVEKKGIYEHRNYEELNKLIGTRIGKIKIRENFDKETLKRSLCTWLPLEASRLMSLSWWLRHPRESEKPGPLKDSLLSVYERIENKRLQRRALYTEKEYS